jgi:hypothetical protein
MPLTMNRMVARVALVGVVLAAALVAPVADAKEIKGNNFLLVATTGACKKGEECTLTLRLEAQGAYHINDSYPYKFTPAKKDDKPLSENVEFVKENFSKAAGDFKKDAEKVGTLTVKFKPTAAKGKIVGTYKMSVCSEQNCQLEQQEIQLDVDAK